MGYAEADRCLHYEPADCMKSPRLLSAATAGVLFATALSVATLYARRMEMRYVHTLAPQMFLQKHQGVALQRVAFRQADLLPIYGSSELNLRNPYHPSAFFREYPTGFTVFPVGNVGSTSLIWLQALAGVGRVRDQLAEEDLLVRIQRMDHQVEELPGFGLKLQGLDGRSGHECPPGLWVSAQGRTQSDSGSSRPFERRALGWEFPLATSNAEV